MTWTEIAQLGVPTLVLVGIGLGLYWGIPKVWNDLLIPFKTRHFEFLDSQQRNGDKNTGTLTELANSNREQVVLLKSFTNDFQRWTKTQDERMARLTTMAENAPLVSQMVKRTNTDKMVLVVDDDVVARNAIKWFLVSTGGLGVLMAANGRQALDILKASLVDLVVLDLNIPMPDGNEVLRWIAANREEMPVIVVTGDSERLDSDVANIPKKVMVKPIDQKALVSMVQEQLAA